ncbi:DMT family transporter [Alphaproteobacteria bacterium]|nr:DMT family transporter [Alphaproteobacteria bacterium]
MKPSSYWPQLCGVYAFRDERNQISMAQFLLPIIFVVLWSSAFVAGKAGVQHATPFAFLAVRFSIVALIFMAVAVWFWIWRSKSTAKAIGVKDWSNDPILQTALVGVLIHGAYLGSTFFAMANGLGAALAALIVSTQPLLTTALAIFLFGEKPRLTQWIGIFIGFAGVVVVISPSLGINAPVIAITSCVFGLLAITTGTLLQKHIGASIGLLKSNIIQASAASLFFMMLIATVETPHITWNEPFLIALAWQVLAVSTGAYVILMILIKRDSVAATTSLLFLVPPVTAIIAFFIFGEPLTPVTVSGFFMASAGVYLVTRHSSATEKQS